MASKGIAKAVTTRGRVHRVAFDHAVALAANTAWQKDVKHTQQMLMLRGILLLNPEVKDPAC